MFMRGVVVVGCTVCIVAGSRVCVVCAVVITVCAVVTVSSPAAVAVTLIVLSISIRLLVSVGHLRIWIAQTCQVSGAWACIEVAQDRVITITRLNFGHLRVGIGNITKSDGTHWPGIGAV